MTLVDVVQQRVDEPLILEAAQDACRTVEAFFYLIRDVNAFARNVSLDPQRTLLDGKEFIEETLRFLSLELSNVSADPVDMHVDVSIDVVELDPNRVRQAVLSLLRNALRASEPGSRVEIVLCSTAPRELRIEVRDSGEGMDEETLARCHEPFFSRFDPPSLGMGLEIARLVVEAHKGRLEIESDETGTTATLVLPGACADMELP